MSEQLSPYHSYMYSYPHKTAYRTFDVPVALAPRLEALAGREASLYFHIPFCRYKCGYCNLFSEQGCHPQRVADYLDTLERHVLQLAPLAAGLCFSSFAVGGGTPLVLSPSQLDRLMKMAQHFGVSPSGVFTSIETSPHYAGLPMLNELRRRGVERLSIGVQSFDAGELRQLKRAATPGIIRQALDNIQEVGFPQFNLDLIYGIAGQTVDSFLRSLEEALACHPDEVFIYPLYVRPETGIRERASDEACLSMYRAGCELLCSAGFTQTSMRRFVRRKSVGLEFSCGDEIMLSCGVGGRSYLGDLHFATPYVVRQPAIRQEIDRYRATTDFTVATHGILLSAEEQCRRFLIKNLMYYRGIDVVAYETRFGEPLDEGAFAGWIDRGWIVKEGSNLRLTPLGMAYSDYIGQLFISAPVRKRMEE